MASNRRSTTSRSAGEGALPLHASGSPSGVGGGAGGDALNPPLHHLALRGGERPPPPSLEEPLAEVVELPQIEVAVERAPEDDRGRRLARLERLGPGAEARERIDRPL